jgi:glycosyltransferase involved in cell wall biosynthesis
MRRPTVTALVTAYNHEAFIEQALASVLRQAEPLEVLIAPDLSADGTAAIVEGICKHPAGRHRIVRLPVPAQRLGLARNYDRALSAATGDWVMICEGDDVSALERSDALMEALTRPSGPPAVFGSRYRIIDAEGRERDAPQGPPVTADAASTPVSDPSPLDLHGCTLAFPRVAYTHYGRLSHRLMTVDSMLLRRALSLRPHAVVKHASPLVAWRVFGANTSDRFRPPKAGRGRYREYLASLFDHEVAQLQEARRQLRQLEQSDAPPLVRRRFERELAYTLDVSRMSLHARTGNTALLCHALGAVRSPFTGSRARHLWKHAVLGLGPP